MVNSGATASFSTGCTSGFAAGWELVERAANLHPGFLQAENSQNRDRSAIAETISEKPCLFFLTHDSLAHLPQSYEVREKPLVAVDPQTLHARRPRPGSSKSSATEWPRGGSVIQQRQSPLTWRGTQALEPTNHLVATPTTTLFAEVQGQRHPQLHLTIFELSTKRSWAVIDWSIHTPTGQRVEMRQGTVQFSP